MNDQSLHGKCSHNFDEKMASIMHAERLNLKKILNLSFETLKMIFLGLFFLGVLAVAVYSESEAPGRLLEYCARSAWRCPMLFDWQAPWWFWLRALQVLLLPPLLSLSLPWLVNHRRWKAAWWGYAFYQFAFGCAISLIGEGLIMMGGLPTRFGGLVVLLDTCLLIFMLSLAFRDQDLLEKFGGLEKMSRRVTGIGVGILAVLGVAFGRMAAENGENIFLLVFGIIFTPWLIVLSGKGWSQTLWRLSPWRVEAELRQASAKQGNDDKR